MGTMVKLMVVLLCFASVSSSIMVMGYRRGEGGRGEEKGETFMLEKSKQVVKTEAGEIRVVKGWNKGKGGQSVIDDHHQRQNAMHIGFISMEPKTLFIPQYVDSSLIMFVRRGDAKIGWIYKDGLVERRLKIGDIYRIPAGSAFYIVNTGKGQRLQIICSIDPSESLGRGVFQSFFIGGGTNPSSVLSGFDHRTLTTAFNVSASQLEEIMTRQQGGPIIYIEGGHEPSRMASFMQLKQQERLKQMDIAEEDDEEQETTGWSWRKLLNSVFMDNKENKGGKTKTVKAPDTYNLYDRKPDFQNNYGWSVALDENDYTPLSHSGVGVYLVNLTAGSMMAPHVNPTATEYGIVLSGAGTIQVVYPNGSLAMNARVEEGDVFWVPRYFPFCQIASRSGPMEFFGFTTSARKNRPQFLVGASSILQTMSGPELAMAFDVSEEKLKSLINAQRESVILPSAPVSEPDEQPEDQVKKEMEMGGMGSLIKNVGSQMIMGFD
ncbi:Cupin 1 [Macleaya cordata]|uniref:Cupin 1 n=1 Tax=Macleaya cordata TaxID=56857 RepID=A0A200R633_MACCD|nr:Cupin 1 [Macleaya cordata]